MPRPPLWNTVVNRGSSRASSSGASAGGGLQRVAQGAGLVRRHLDDKAPTTLERHAHDDAASLLGDLEGTVAGPGLHGRHSVLPPSAFPPVRCALPGHRSPGLGGAFSSWVRVLILSHRLVPRYRNRSF